jgi:hypothetical protein
MGVSYVFGGELGPFSLSPSGLTRWAKVTRRETKTAEEVRALRRRMDARVKPAHDDL